MFTKAAAQRILKGIATKVETVRVLPNVIQVTYRTKNGRCSTFISKKAFDRDFVEFRQTGAKLLIVESVRFQENVYNVYNADKGTYYVVSCQVQTHCTCEDYQQNGKTCKHGWAVLMGLGSLADAIAA